MADVRATYGNDTFRGSTVCAVKGFVRPNFSLQTGFSTGVLGIRVCNAGDLVAPVGVEQTPGGALGQEADWLWYQPFLNDDAGTPDDAVATSNMGHNKWSLDTQSVRRMDEQAQTIGLFYYLSAGNPAEASPIDYHLSLGLRV